MATLSPLESAARDLIASHRMKDGSMTEQAVCGVFWVQWAHSLTVEKIQEIAKAINGWDGDFQKACTAMVKAKILRTSVYGGVRHYELNLPE